MEYFKLLIFLLTITFLTFSCVETEEEILTTDTESSSSSLTGNNNSAIITGGQIGDNSESMAQMSKALSITIQTPHRDFTLETPYAGRTSSSSETIYWSIPITNTSASSYCFVQLYTISFYDSSSNLLASNSFTYIDGSVGKGSSIYTDTCLASGEKGFFNGIEIEDNLYSNVSKMVVGSIDTSSYSYSDPEYKVIPQSYQTSGTYNDPLINVKNEANIQTYIWNSMMFLLDSNNNPVMWDTITGGHKINPNSSLDISNLVMYKGSVSKIHVILSLDEPPSSSRLKGSNEMCLGQRDQRFKCFKEKRDLRIDKLRQNQ